MHRFTIVPIDQSHQSVEVIASDAAAVLPVIDRLHCGEVNVLRNNDYVFSAETNANGFWSIFRRLDAIVVTRPGIEG